MASYRNLLKYACEPPGSHRRPFLRTLTLPSSASIRAHPCQSVALVITKTNVSFYL